jgi:hypothetical protein
VHEGGFTIVTRSPGQWALLSPAGVTIDPTPAPSAEPVPPLPHDDNLRDDAVSGHWDGTRLDIDYSVQCLTQRASAEAFDPDTNGRWHDNVDAMHEHAATSNDIYYPDEPDEPYTW